MRIFFQDRHRSTENKIFSVPGAGALNVLKVDIFLDYHKKGCIPVQVATNGAKSLRVSVNREKAPALGAHAHHFFEFKFQPRKFLPHTRRGGQEKIYKTF